MGIEVKDNPFQAGTGHVPSPLPGRDEETRLLARMIGRLDSPRAANRFTLAKPPFAPVKIVGPRGVGKTALLNWTKKQADDRLVRFVSCEGLKFDEEDFSLRTLLRNIRRACLPAAGAADMAARPRDAELAYTEVARAAVEAGPLLLLMDEVQHYDPPLLQAVLQGSQKLIGEGYPLGLVLAGTPKLDSRLARAGATFADRGGQVYINTLSDEATRAALRAPCEEEGVKVTPAALKEMAAQTDNYPYFIQLVGSHAWDEMAAAGREEIGVRTVRKIGEKARAGREYVYDKAFVRIRDGDLLPQARRVMEMFESLEGQVYEEAGLDLLAADGASASRARELLASLKEDGFIWTVRGRTSPGIPSFFIYFKERCKREKMPSA